MRLNKQQLEKIIKGSTILGTGGGGRYDSALDTINNLKMVDLVSADDLKPDDIVITAYGAGGLTKSRSTKKVVRKGLRLLEKRLGRTVKAIVPVEIGPYSLAVAFELAQQLGVPVVDGDLVGFRSVPEIYIELVTLAKLSRTPLVFGNNAGDLILFENESSAENLEIIIRSFADTSESNTFVLGYPYTKMQLRQCVAPGSVSYCLDIGHKLTDDFQLLDSGIVIKDEKKEVAGFTQGSLAIKTTNQSIYEAVFKNEYLVLLKNEKILVTCPDLICVIEEKTGLGLNNGDNNNGKAVSIYARAAIKQWRTPEGLALFLPKNLGLDYKQKVLE